MKPWLTLKNKIDLVLIVFKWVNHDQRCFGQDILEYLNMKMALFPDNTLWFMVRLILSVSGLVVVLYFIQDKLLFHPEVMQLSQVIKIAASERMVLWPATEDYHGLVTTLDTDQSSGTVFVFHGNAGSATDRFYYSENLVTLGYRTILLEYPGYGARLGNDLSEKNLIAEGTAAIKQALSEFGRPIFIIGESLGAGVAAGVVYQNKDVIDGIILVTPWDNLPNIAQSIYWFLPAKYITKYRFDSVEHLRTYHGPLVVLIAEQDEIIPRSSSMALYDQYQSTKKLVILSNVTHNTWPSVMDQNRWLEIMSFLSINVQKPEY